METENYGRKESRVSTGKKHKLRRVGLFTRTVLRCKEFLTGVTVIPTFVVVLVLLMGIGLVLETRVIDCVPAAPEIEEAEMCTPNVLNASDIEYHSGHRYYSALKSINSVRLPVLRKKKMELCEEESQRHAKFRYCLPISGRKDTPFCTAADRMDLLNLRSSGSICYASVLHMLLVEVYEELQATGNTPFLAFGSLLGAVRNGSMIPFTEDIDIGFVDKLENKELVKEALKRKGYHMFFLDIWRVCVAPTHPLAGHLYDKGKPITRNYGVPYLDLYMMQRQNNSAWDLQGFEGGPLSDDRVLPFSQVTINGMSFDTVNDPTYFLETAYGSDYMTPKERPTPLGLATKEQLQEAIEKLKRGSQRLNEA